MTVFVCTLCGDQPHENEADDGTAFESFPVN
jgi:hypothetical protein